MHLVDQRVLGIVILVLLTMMVIVKQMATGSVLDKPKGNLMVQVVNIFNLFFLLVVNPLAAVLLITRGLPANDPTHLIIHNPFLTILEAIGFVLYVTGYLVMAWALMTLGRNYQLGGSTPRSEDTIIMDGPYGFIRHPMYGAALSIALGLACLIQSLAVLCVFCIYLVLIALLIPAEENTLRKAYGEQYSAYQQKTRKLIPSVY